MEVEDKVDNIGVVTCLFISGAKITAKYRFPYLGVVYGNCPHV